MIMTRLLALGAVLAVLTGAAPASSESDSLYALRYGAKANLLTAYDPVRLVPSGPSIRLGHFAQAWSISPDREHFVAAAGWRPTKGESAAVRFVDLARGRVEGTLSLPGELGRVTATAWFRGRVLIVVTDSSATRIYAVDPDRRVIVSRVEVQGIVVLGERTASKLVLLLASSERIGPATLAVVDRAARVRTVLLEGLDVGTATAGVGEERRLTIRRPALALAPSGRRAFVLGAGEPPASIDLRTLSIRHAPLRLPAVAAKQAEGSVRTAATLPDGRIVVGGYDYGASSAQGAAGLWLVNPRSWSRRLLDRDGSWFRVAGGLVFARGDRGFGLRILRPSGAPVELFRSGSVARVTVVGPRAYVTFFGGSTTAAVVELDTGRVVRRSVPANPLVGAGQPIIG